MCQQCTVGLPKGDNILMHHALDFECNLQEIFVFINQVAYFFVSACKYVC